MNKYLKYLEEYSQWIALALGGFWLLYMVYAHVLASDTSSVTVKGAPTDLGPASVDQYVNDSLEKLKEGINSPGKPLPDNLGDAIGAVSAAFNDDDQIAMINPAVIPSQMVFDPTGMREGPGGPGGGPQPVVINALPQIPAATEIGVVAGKSIVTGAGGANGGAGVQQRQLWATVFGTIKMKDLAAAFAAANIPKLNAVAAEQTLVLKVDVVREEVLANGSTGATVTIASQPINLNGQNPPTNPMPPFPPQGANPGVALQFIHWAQTNEPAICQPAFFVVNKGDNWRKPGEALVNVGAPAVAVQPTDQTATPNKTRPTTPTNGGGGVGGQIRNSGQGGGGAPRGGRGGGGGGPRGSVDPTLLDPPTVIYAEQMFDPSDPSHNGPPMGGAPGQPFGGAPGGPPGAAAAAAPVIADPPTGPFIPLATQPDIHLWVHDLTVQSGKTYRYKLRYTISNPVFGFRNLVANPQLSGQFNIDAPYSLPSQPTTIPDTTTFFVAGQPIRSEVKFDIFVWDVNGIVKKQVTASPGDQLDDNLPITVVDVREVGSNYEIMLVDQDGNIIVRNLKTDLADPKYRELLTESAAPKTTP